jgi:MerR family transcriptional regulator, redox-sensitive transcriptional activator SoxR
MEATLSIGELAKRAGLSVSAIRFYEDRGLLPEAERSGGQRRFTADAVGRLAAIAAAKRAGLTLAEVHLLLSASDGGAPAHEHVRALAARKLPEVEAQIERAERSRAWLALAGSCRCETLEECALFAA